MLMTGPNAGLFSSHLPSCAANTHFCHCYGNGLLFMVAQWLAGQPASWVGGLVGGGGSVFPESFGAEEHQDGPD